MRPAFAPGSIALGLHTSSGSAPSVIDALRRQAIEASVAGFDGVSLSEHHGGFPAYLSAPTMVAGILLSAMPSGWAGPCPTILPLRDVVPVVEDLAWLSAAYPGRVGAGFVPGYQDRDFMIVGRPFRGRVGEFRDALATAASVLRGEAQGPLAEDPAIAALAEVPVPVICGIGGPKGAAHAAASGVGILLTSMLDPPQAKQIADAYWDAGGRESCVLVRRAWVGTPPSPFDKQLARYRSVATQPGALETGTGEIVIHGEPSEIAGRLADQVNAVGAGSLNLRMFAEDASPDELVAQVATVGREVLPELRRQLGWDAVSE